MKKSLILALSAACALAASAAKVTYTNGVLNYTEEAECGNVRMVFQKCMTNKLFTFYNIYLNNKLVNSASSSDNIGPFCVSGGVWMGANHNTPQGGPKPSAYTREVSVTVDGEELTSGTVDGVKVVLIKVHNEIYYTDDKKFADENVTYRVSGNSIEVWANHTFAYPSRMMVTRYYGPQSMFPATELLLPGTKNKGWISLPGKSAVDVMKSEKPDFSTYIERNANGYQAVLKYNEGLGNASRVSTSGEVYLFRNYGGATGKSYHVMMWDSYVTPGMTTDWHALYTWFDTPVEDGFRSGAENPTLVYASCIDGEPTDITIDANGKSTEPVSGIEDVVVDEPEMIAIGGDGVITISADSPDAVCADLSGKIIARGAGTFACPAGVYIVSNSKGHSIKLCVK